MTNNRKTPVNSQPAEAESEFPQSNLWPWSCLPSLVRRDIVISSPYLAAYEIGKLVVLLDFHMQQSALAGNDGYHQKKTASVFEALRLRAADVDWNRPADTVRKQITTAENHWQNRWGSPAFDEEKHRVNELLNDARFTEDCFRSFREQQCNELIRYFLDLAAKLRRYLLSTVTAKLRTYSETGACIQRGPCRANVYQQMWDPKIGNAAVPPDLKAFLATRPPSQTSDHRENCLANTSFDPGKLPPDVNWLPELERMLVTIGFPIPRRCDLAKLEQDLVTIEQVKAQLDQLDRYVCFTGKDQASLIEKRSDFVKKLEDAQDAIAELDQAVGDFLKNKQHPMCSKPVKSYLGLIFDEERGQVRRGGNCIDIGPKTIFWKLLGKLAREGEKFSSVEMLRKTVWDRIVADDTVTSTVNKLEQKIQPLGLEFENQRGSGWRLTESATQPAKALQKNRKARKPKLRGSGR